MKYKATLCGKIFGPDGPVAPVIKPNGYAHFSQSEGYGKPNQTLWHRFVYEFWKGEIPKGKVIDHKNGNRLDNRLSNLQIISQRDNVRKGLSTKISEEVAYYIRNSSERGVTLAKEFGISQQTVCDIRKGRRWKTNN